MARRPFGPMVLPCAVRCPRAGLPGAARQQELEQLKLEQLEKEEEEEEEEEKKREQMSKIATKETAMQLQRQQKSC